jgi:hypothetical protein
VTMKVDTCFSGQCPVTEFGSSDVLLSYFAPRVIELTLET